MNTVPAPINLDKLRHAVQRFGTHSFTTGQLATDYMHDQPTPNTVAIQRFEDLLHRHAALLGITPQPSSAGGDTVWLALH